MPSREFVETLTELRHRTLHPTEHNRGQLPERLSHALRTLAVPSHPDGAWLGTAPPDLGWLRDFEAVPEHMSDPDLVLRGVTAGLGAQLRAHAPGNLFNIFPVPLFDAVTAATLAQLYTPNALWDLLAGGTLEIERQLVRQLADLAGWPRDDAGGTFSFGGKAGLMYAVRIGLNRCLPESGRRGLAGGAAPVVVTTEHNHDSVEPVCALLGLGSEACVRVPAPGRDRAATAERVLTTVADLVARGTPVACVVLSGGSIMDHTIDPVGLVAAGLSSLSGSLPYRPYLHFDTAHGWPWLFFRDYDFPGNPLEIDPVTLAALREVSDLVAEAAWADSMTADFHKAGFCPYPSSAFLARNAAELHTLHEDPHTAEWRPWGGNLVLHHTIEHSRGAAGILAAFAALHSVGRTGFRVHLAHVTAMNNVFRAHLPEFGYELVNPTSPGMASVFWPVAPGGPATFAELGRAEPLLVDDANRYTQALYQRLAGLDPQHEVAAPIVLGFLPAFTHGAHGHPLSALRLLPNSPHHDEVTVAAIADRMATAKAEFDRSVTSRTGPLAGLRLRHVPE
ncbi:hypothetical protein [Actinoalloteichus caeruleus]|uniref:Glutamate or tyrosine decarboxylase n=1 Tax=Actinoalloteichus caeruleus DSM 43889 TaxID=1120930 RepID=A0ABT1JDX8_ACTCY|nr:hypothetical protein [Actinoalloteichus caeruleus]MCP2330331.1 Glutamate or tyrosine decarboxylase [Actinoalloteichus caeruleus DSM 43889]